MKALPILIGLLVTVATTTLAADAADLPGLARDLTRRPNALVVLTDVTDLTGARHLADAGHLVLALTDDERVPALRQQAGPGIGKTLYINSGSARRIPLADNYANAIVGTDRARLDEAAIAEIIRALAPRGAAALPIASSIDAQRVRQLLPDVAGLSVTIRGEHIVIRKPMREGSDDWSYWNHSPSNNPVSGEENVSWPLQTQWLGKPFRVTRHTFALVADGIYYTGMEAAWDRPGSYIEARDAHNGRRLWRKAAPDDVNLMLPTWIAANGKLFGTMHAEIVTFEGATGKELGRLRLGADDRQIKWLVCNGQTFYALLGSSDLRRYTSRTGRHETGDFVPMSETIVAYADTGRGTELWRIEDEGIDARAIGMLGGTIYYYARGKHLRAVAARTGKTVWSNADPELMTAMASPLDPGGKIDGITLYRSGLLCTPEVIVLNLQSRARRAGFDARTGKLLWENRLVAGNSGRGGSMLAFAGQLHAKGMRPSPIDLRTGEAVGPRSFSIGGGCGRNTATATGLIGFLGEVVCADGTMLSSTRLAKPECHLGTFAANGLLFNPQGGCGCALPLIGLLVECSAGPLDLAELVARGDRLTTYTAAPTGDTRSPHSAVDWTTWAGSNSHSGFLPVRVGDGPRHVTWVAAAPADDPPAPPIAVGDTTYVADVAGHLRALGPAGDERWEFIAGGPFHASPTYWRGMIFAGCADGRVYCLDAATGEPVWKYHAAPTDRSIMVYDRLSNAWPVNSGVLIHEGVAYFIAGLTDRDGTLAYALDAATGEPRWVSPNLGWIEKDRRAGLNCNGYLTVFDGRLRFNSGSKRQAALDLETGRPIPFPVQPRILIDGDRAVTTGIGHVNDGLLVRGGNRAFYGPDERLARGVRFSFKLPGDGAESMFAVAPYQSSNVMPVWDEASLFVARHDRFEKTLQAWDIGATEQWVRDVVASKAASPERQIRFTLSTERLGSQSQPKPVWSKDMEVVGLAVAEDALLVVSTAFENKRTRSGRQSWTLHALRKTSGEELWSVALPGPPAISPLAIRADGSVLVALQDGYVLGIGRMAKPETGREQSKVNTSEAGPR